MSKLTVSGSWTQFVAPLRNKTDFTTHGSLKGTSSDSISFGKLPREFWFSAEQSDYVVYSYSTPIAWHVASSSDVPASGSTNAHLYDVDPNGGVWVIPTHKYSVTTSRQLGRIHTAISQLGIYDVKTFTYQTVGA